MSVRLILSSTPPSRTLRALLRVSALLGCLLSPALMPVQADPAIPPGEVRIHYYRPDSNYSGWALYTWNASTENASWCQSEVAITGTDSFGVYFDVTVSPTQGTPPGDLGFIINNCAANQIKDPGPDQHLQTTLYNQAWVIHGNATLFTTQPLRSRSPTAFSASSRPFGWIAPALPFRRNTCGAVTPMRLSPASLAA